MWILIALLPVMSGSLTQAGPTQGALKVIDGMGPSRLGVDHLGRLGVWDATLGRVVSVSTSGAKKEITSADFAGGEAASVAIDSSWGVVGIRRHNRSEIFIVDWSSHGVRSMQLDGEAGSVCWLGADRLAVSTRRSEHDVEVWDLTRKQRVMMLGDAERRDGQRHRRPRLTFLSCPFGSGRVYSFDSYSGRVRAYDASTGEKLFETVRQHPGLQASELRVKKADEAALASGDAGSVIIILWDGFTVDSKGVVWTALEGSQISKTVTLLGIQTRSPVQSDLRRQVILESCISPRFVLWGGYYISYREPASGVACISYRRFE